MKKQNESKESKVKRAESLGLPLQIEQKKRKSCKGQESATQSRQKKE